MATPISSITGLQNLPNLESFNADWNCLVSVDFSNLVNLVSIDISDCDQPGSGTPSLTSVNVSGCISLESIRFDDSDFSGGVPDLRGLENLRFFDFDQCQISGNFDASFLPSLDDFDLSGNGELNGVTISSSQPLGQNGQYVNIGNCALTQESVDSILVSLSENGISGGTVDLGGGTSSPPSQIGIDAISVLNNNGWQVYVN